MQFMQRLAAATALFLPVSAISHPGDHSALTAYSLMLHDAMPYALLAAGSAAFAIVVIIRRVRAR